MSRNPERQAFREIRRTLAWIHTHRDPAWDLLVERGLATHEEKHGGHVYTRSPDGDDLVAAKRKKGVQ